MRPFALFATAPASVLSALLVFSGIAQVLAEENGLKIEVIKAVECVRKTHNGDNISVNYKGTLQSDGSEFDSSYGFLKEPFSFDLGRGQVIKGWDQGLLDMCIGEKRTLIIPPELGYGNQGAGGAIPPGATLVFETELMGIKGVKAEPPPASSSAVASSTESAVFSIATAPTLPPTSAEAADHGSPDGPKDDKGEDKGECKLLGPFALLIQGALGGLAVLALVFKRWRETPRRPLKIWFFDVSKQVVGSVLLHMANLFMSMLSSGDFDFTAKSTVATAVVAGKERQLNPCSFYLLNLAIDTTIGIPILVFLLHLLHIAFSYSPLAHPPESLKSGSYGYPPHATWWLKQSFIYFIGLFGMKTCVFILFQLLPWLAWVGDWALRWTEGNAALQITFVMLVFPLIMNAMQYWIIDSFIKDPAGSWEGHQPVPQDDEGEEEGLVNARISEDSIDSEAQGREEDRVKKSQITTRSALKEANPTPIDAEYDPEIDGEGSSASTLSSIKDEDKKK